MSSALWDSIQNEMRQAFALRKGLISKIGELFEDRYLISFYTSFKGGSSIDESDFEMLRTILLDSKKLKKRKIIFIINSPGGNPLAAEKIIKLLSEYSDNDYWALIPGTAKSAATLICFGASKIILSPISELGPIDLQIYPENDHALVPTHSIINAYDKLMEMGINLEDGKNIAPILQQLQNFNPTEVETFRRVNELASDIAAKVLKKGMMKSVAKKEIKKVINIFLDPETSKTHGRPIFESDISEVDKKKYFNIDCINTTEKKWQTINEYHLRMVWHMRVTGMGKIIESEENSLEAKRQ